MSDIVERAKAALEEPDDGRYGFCETCGEYVQDADAPTRPLVEELVAEVERLRAGGPWVEHVERMEAMKRTRDGECICDGNQETTDGPDEFCPWHGRSYRELVEGLESQAAEVERLRRQIANRTEWDPAWGSPYDVLGDV